jgi:hypothetical protein
MQDLKSLDELNKPISGANRSSPSTPKGSPKLNRAKPEFAKAENMAKTLFASAKLPNKSTPQHAAGPHSRTGGASKSSSADPKFVDKRMEKMYKINRYLETFARVRETVQVPANLANLSEADLDQILFNIQRVLNCSSPEAMIPIGINMMFGQIENVTMNYQFNPLNLDLTGLSQVCTVPENTAKLTEIAKELYIKYEHLFSMGPESRFFVEIIGFLMTVNSYNKAKHIVVTDDQLKEVADRLNEMKGKEPIVE